MHEHKLHQYCCEHEHLAYCKHCHVVYCKDCGREWREYTFDWTYHPYWVYTTTADPVRTTDYTVTVNNSSQCNHDK